MSFETTGIDLYIRNHIEGQQAFAEEKVALESMHGTIGNVTTATTVHSRAVKENAEALDKHAGSAKNFEEAMHHSSRLLGETGGAAEGLSTKLGALQGLMGAGGAGIAAGALAGTAALGFLVTSMKEGGDSAIALAESTHKLQLESGMSAEAASGLISTFNVLGVSGDLAERAIFKMAHTVDTSPAKFQALGVEIAKNSDGSTNLAETLGNVADAYQKSGDAATRDAILFEAFGKNGKDLAVVLEQGRAGLEEFRAEAARNGGIINEQQIQSARDYAIATRENKEAWEGFTRSLAMTAFPVLTTMEASLTRQITGHETWRDVLRSGLPPPLQMVANLTGILSEDTKHATNAADAHVAALKAQMAALDNLNKTQSAGLSDLNKSIDLTQRVRTEDQNVKDAIQSVANAQDKLNQETAKYGPTSDQAKTAADALAKAQDGVVNAMLSDAKTTMDLAVLKDKLAGGSENAAAASQAEIDKLEVLEGQLAPGSPMRTGLDGYIGQLKDYLQTLSLIPDTKFTTIHQTLQKDSGDPGTGFSAPLPGFAAIGRSGVLGPMARGADSGGINVSITVNAQTDADPHAIADVVNRNLARALARNGTFLS